MTSNIMPEDYKKMTDQEIKDCTEYDILYRHVWPKPDDNMVKEMKRMYNNEPTVYKSVEVIDNPTIIE